MPLNEKKLEIPIKTPITMELIIVLFNENR